MFIIFDCQGIYFKKLEKLLESCLSLATSRNDENGTERKEESKNNAPSGKEKLAMFAFKENDSVCNSDASKTCREEKARSCEKENGISGQENKEGKEVHANGKEGIAMETNGKEKVMEANAIKNEEEEEKMDTEESVSVLPLKKPAKGETTCIHCLPLELASILTKMIHHNFCDSRMIICCNTLLIRIVYSSTY